MIENLTKEELKTLLLELKANGYEFRQTQKSMILEQEAEKLGMDNCHICDSLSKSIYGIADWVTNNTEVKKTKSGGPQDGMWRKYTNQRVDASIEDEYRKICCEILKVIQPYYGRDGFKQSEWRRK